MDEGLVKVTPDKEKAKSILKMVEITLELIGTIDKEKFPSNMVKEYYDVIRELASIILLLDGFKTKGDGAHKQIIEYVQQHFEEFSEHEISVWDDLRLTRNKISYDGFFVEKEYLENKLAAINAVILKLRSIINKKLS